jgi:hypothetical protein
MSYKQTSAQIAQYRGQITELRKQMRAAQAAIESEEVVDYAFTRADGGTTKLSDLFSGQDTLFVIHNMGAGCVYCTLWADGFNGVYDHLRSRAGFALSSPDAPAEQQKFAASRGWKFPMISYQRTTFGEDMGYRVDGCARPGVSASRCFGGRAAGSCAYPIRASSQVTISAVCGTSSICCPRAARTGSPSTSMRGDCRSRSRVFLRAYFSRSISAIAAAGARTLPSWMK